MHQHIWVVCLVIVAVLTNVQPMHASRRRMWQVQVMLGFGFGFGAGLLCCTLSFSSTVGCSFILGCIAVCSTLIHYARVCSIRLLTVAFWVSIIGCGVCRIISPDYNCHYWTTSSAVCVCSCINGLLQLCQHFGVRIKATKELS